MNKVHTIKKPKHAVSGCLEIFALWTIDEFNLLWYFLFITSLKQCGFLLVVSCFLGLVFHSSLVVQSFNGELSSKIQEKQLNDLKAKAEQLSGDIRFIDLMSAKKLYDEQQAFFLDSRSEEEYQTSTIQGWCHVPSGIWSYQVDTPSDLLFPSKRNSEEEIRCRLLNF